MRHRKKSKRNNKAKKVIIFQYMKPFTEKVPPLTGHNDKRYISSGTDDEPNICTHDYCLAERKRLYGMKGVQQQPIGLPWSTGLLKYLPGHVKYPFPLRKKNKYCHADKNTLVLQEPAWKPDTITDPEMSCVYDEIIYTYKVFILAGMIISKAKEAEMKDANELPPS